MPVSATVSRAALAGARPVFRPSAVSLQARRAFHGAGGFRPGGAGGRGWQYYASGGQRRWQSTAEGAARAGWFQRMWDSPIGLKTVHFWAPVMKWALVLAGISDFARPAEKLSVTQNAALTATGLIWTRWCLIIKPKNYLLAAVNFFLGLVGIVQCSRIFLYKQSQKDKTAVPASVDEAKQEIKEVVKS